MDSLTRYAQAQREIGLAVGEAPATKGYPPSVFARLPQLVERAGNGDAGGGSITAFYTVLTEGDDPQDPIADAARAILDGHIVLSRRIAESGQYPAIDVEASVSRVMYEIVSEEHVTAARTLRELLATYNQSRELINLGAWKAGANELLDRAVALYPAVQSMLVQRPFEQATYEESVQRLTDTIRGDH
jgi:flagellum-specific ATP synthase